MNFNPFLSKRIKFKSSSFTEQCSDVPNPSRGWYQIFTFHLPQTVNFQKLSECLRHDQTLVLVLIDIGKYRDRELDEAAVQHVSQILEYFSAAQKDVILRFVYDCEGNGILHEPALFSVIEKHIQQLTPVIRTYTKNIFVLQGLFLGSWGEMHGSKFLSPIFMRKLYNLLLSASGSYTWLAVRKPVQWRCLHNPNQKPGKMGLFDDGILGSDTNLGTFGSLPQTSVKWEDSWCPEDELAFEYTLCQKVPNGGEVVYSQLSHGVSDSDAINILQRMHITYLNCIHDAKLLNLWKGKASPWSNVSFYDYIGAHLGYRFCVRAVKLQKRRQNVTIVMTIENNGFASCYEDYVIALEIVSEAKMIRQETNWNLRSLMPGTTEKWQCFLPDVKGRLYLTAHREKDGKVLCFANAEQENGKLYLGQIF